jgi:ABC-type nitrate/sulfonate/bicarbonate transport system substrate-binding protein
VRRTNISRAIAALLGITLMFAAGTQRASTAGPDVIHVGRAVSTAFAFAALEVGVDAKIWDKVGLKLDISSFKGDADIQRGMTAGQLDFALGGGPSMGYHAKGVPGIAVASMYGPPTDMAIVVSGNGGIKSVNDLKGKKLGVTTSGSLTDWLVHALKAGAPKVSTRSRWAPPRRVSPRSARGKSPAAYKISGSATNSKRKVKAKCCKRSAISCRSSKRTSFSRPTT